jgi:hypothetical protein
MTDIPKAPDKGPPSPSEQTPPTKPSDAPRRRPTDAELIARGWKKLEPTGKGYGLPMGLPRCREGEAHAADDHQPPAHGEQAQERGVHSPGSIRKSRHLAVS